jgi:hypothetical protein
MTLDDALRAQHALLDKLFGQGAYRINSEDAISSRVFADWMELSLIYDQRDQFISSAIKPLRVPSEIAEDHQSTTLLRYLDVQFTPHRKSALYEQQVRDELTRIAPLVELFRDEQRSRDATWFVRGYNAAYTDHFSGEW